MSGLWLMKHIPVYRDVQEVRYPFLLNFSHWENQYKPCFVDSYEGETPFVVEDDVILQSGETVEPDPTVFYDKLVAALIVALFIILFLIMIFSSSQGNMPHPDSIGYLEQAVTLTVYETTWDTSPKQGPKGKLALTMLPQLLTPVETHSLATSSLLAATPTLTVTLNSPNVTLTAANPASLLTPFPYLFLIGFLFFMLFGLGIASQYRTLHNQLEQLAESNRKNQGQLAELSTVIKGIPTQPLPQIDATLITQPHFTFLERPLMELSQNISRQLEVFQEKMEQNQIIIKQQLEQTQNQLLAKSSNDFEQQPQEDEELMDIKPGWAVVITRSKGETEAENQDAGIAIGETSSKKHRAIAVADGVGMGKHSSIASKKLMEEFEKLLQKLLNSRKGSQHQMEELLTHIHGKILNEVPQDETSKSWGTTFLAVVESEKEFLFTHLGDGNIYQLVLNEKERQFEALPMLLGSAHTDTPPQITFKGPSEPPRFVSEQKRNGSIWVVATDGMNEFERYMEDQTKIKGKEAIERLVEEIWMAFQKEPKAFGENEIKEILWRWLKRCQSSDDATVAILIDGEMWERWHKIVKGKELPVLIEGNSKFR